MAKAETTASGDYWPYAELLRGDGFVTRAVDVPSTAERLENCDIVIVATPVHGSNRDDWAFPLWKLSCAPSKQAIGPAPAA